MWLYAVCVQVPEEPRGGCCSYKSLWAIWHECCPLKEQSVLNHWDTSPALIFKLYFLVNKTVGFFVAFSCIISFMSSLHHDSSWITLPYPYFKPFPVYSPTIHIHTVLYPQCLSSLYDSFLPVLQTYCNLNTEIYKTIARIHKCLMTFDFLGYLTECSIFQFHPFHANFITPFFFTAE